jgi:CHAT domain
MSHSNENPESVLEERLFQEAVVLFDRGRLEESAQLFQRVVELRGRRAIEALQYLERARRELLLGDVRYESRSIPIPRILESGESSSTATDSVRRTPHMDIVPGAPAPGEQIEVVVYADARPARPGEDALDITLEAPLHVTRFDIDVTLVGTPHFVLPDASTTLIIERAVPQSTPARFTAQVKSNDLLRAEHRIEQPASLTALFSYRGRPCGRVNRIVEIAAVSPGAGHVASTTSGQGPGPVIALNPHAGAPDLIVTIVAAPVNDGRQFYCTVRSALLPEYAAGVTREWNLKDVTSRIVDGFMKDFTAKNLTPGMRIAHLRGAGMKLFESAPAHFRRAFWALVDAGLPVRTIAVVSEEPFIPWELMIPRRDDGSDARQPLGVEFTVGRYTSKMAVCGPIRIGLGTSYAVAPQYAGNRALPHAQSEAEFIRDRFGGTIITPASFDQIDATLGSEGRSLVHFACHGTSGDGKQTIYLDQNMPLSSVQIIAMEGVDRAFRKARPLVFLNACEVGRLEPSLAGVGGFAEAFVDLGASAVIAPLWSVKDDLAHEIAMDFYNTTLQEPERPFADILRGIRAKAYDKTIGEDTYAAYCFYGDPLASRMGK